MEIFVIVGAGFVGSHLVDACPAPGHETVVA
jgi:nucleoside-diphosphate-sugar epimerase